MESPIIKQIEKFLQEKKRYKRWLAVFVCLAMIVGFATTAALKMRGRAMTHDERVLNCKLEVHQHTEACYDQEKNIICGYADYVVHRHNGDCYGQNNGNLVCALPEVEAHQHTEECYQEQEALGCGLEESEGHKHTEECYAKEQGELTCQVEEHTHTEECQDEEGTVVCELEEHTHTDECYEWNETLACQQEESEGHAHTAECSQVQKALVCQKPEVELHIHGDECYERVLITPEGEEVVQDPKDNAGVAEEVLAGTANKEVPEGRIECRRICGKLQVEEHTHTQELGCIEIHEVLDGSDLDLAKEPAESLEGETEQNGNGDPETAQTDWDGIEKADLGEAEESITKTFENEEFIVTAAYQEDANIPEEAELIVEEITAESDKEHYAEREAASRESVGDENATMKALLKIGFYVGGQEVEPESPVSVTVQLLNEKGLPEGAPITIVHFADEGTEKLEGSEAVDDATTFKVNKFCEFAIVVTSEDDTTNVVREEDGTKKVDLDKSFQFKTDAYKMTFHIVGDIELPKDAVVPEGDMKADSESQAPEGDMKADSESQVTEGTVPSMQAEAEESDSAEAVTLDGEAGNLEVAMPGAEAEESGTITEIGGILEGEVDDNEESVLGDVVGNGMASDAEANESSEEVGALQELELVAEVLDRDSEQYKLGEAYAEENATGEVVGLEAVTYALAYCGENIDLSDCEVTVTVAPTKKLLQQLAEVGLDTEEDQDVVNIVEVVGEADEKEVGSVVQGSTGTLEFESGSNEFISYLSKIANPEFTVQYYANLDRINLQGPVLVGDIQAGARINADNWKTINEAYKDSIKSDRLPFIDTRGPSLPENGVVPKTVTVPIVNGKAQMLSNQVTEVYEERKFEYIKAPTIKYFNALVGNDGYDLKEIWVQTNGENPTSTNRDDWTVYGKKGEGFDYLHFTNRQETIDKNQSSAEKFVLITSKTVIRMVYDATDGKRNSPAVFYDYDISNGDHTTDNKGVTTMETAAAGINSSENCNETVKYAFGNQNAGTNFGQNEWNGSRLNMTNLNVGTFGYAGCTFGLASSANGENLNFNVAAPKAFGTDAQIGKTRYPAKQDEKFSLDFNRKGDTYTLTGVKGTQTAVNLDTFNHPSGEYGGKLTYYSHILTNNFWPMDGESNMDIQFGGFGTTDKRKTGAGKLPPSDDGKDHNSYFGMYYTVNFDLDKSYVGPLEYLFYGDDDMWVFLNKGNSSQLICDIGGVHSSVGEYVDLWDWIERSTLCDHTDDSCYDGNGNLVCKKNVYNLSFFYTERGASGSSCWMQFTLPSISSMTPETSTNDYGRLKIQKKVTVNKDNYGGFDPDADTFKFDIKLEGAKDDYSYKKYNAEGKVIEQNLIIWDGGSFTLKNGEYIIIDYLPIGTQYTITEQNTALAAVEKDEDGNITHTTDSLTEYYTDVSINGKILKGKEDVIDGKTASGKIIAAKDGMDEVLYTNKFLVFELPQTGGFGTTLYTMAGVTAILLGAGFMYRKKFRERRVGGSS